MSKNMLHSKTLLIIFHTFLSLLPYYLFANIRIFSLPPNKTHEKITEMQQKQKTPPPKKNQSPLRRLPVAARYLSPGMMACPTKQEPVPVFPAGILDRVAYRGFRHREPKHVYTLRGAG